MQTDKPLIAILGGTGALGGGLACRWHAAGYPVVIGSRTQEKAEAFIQEIYGSENTDIPLLAADNVTAAQQAEIVVLTVPFAHQLSTLKEVKSQLSGKILVDVTVPLVPPKVARVQLPEEGSAGQIAQNFLGDDVQVVSAFQNVAAQHLVNGTELVCDVLVCGNNKEARQTVVELVEATGLRGFHAGSIANAAAVEAMTSLLIFINKQYKAHSGIKITGLPED